jgi:hypothetical protein
LKDFSFFAFRLFELLLSFSEGIPPGPLPSSSSTASSVTSSVFFSSDEGTEPEHNTQRQNYEIAEKLHNITLKVSTRSVLAKPNTTRMNGVIQSVTKYHTTTTTMKSSD